MRLGHSRTRHAGFRISTLALAIAAMRFWLSRLAGQHQQALEGQGSKDPAPFYRLWQLRSQAL